MLMGGVIADDGVDRLSDGNLLLDDIEEANELLMAMALPVAADHPCCRRECSSRRTQSSCRAVHNHASWFRRDLSSAAVRAGCGRAPESGSFRRPTGRWRVQADRHGARRRRAICRRSAGRWRVVGQLELAHPVRLETMSAPDALNRTHAEPRRLRHQSSGPVGRLPRRVAKRQGDQALRRLGAQRLDPRGTGLVTKQAVEPVLQRTRPPESVPASAKRRSWTWPFAA